VDDDDEIMDMMKYPTTAITIIILEITYFV
jgi:hypothetical protein